MKINLRELDPIEWSHIDERKTDSMHIVKVFRDDNFFVQVRVQSGTIRLTVNRTDHHFLNGKPIWKDKITWDELQEIKNQCGYADKWMCEYYPPVDDVINVANMRHLWLIDEPRVQLKNNRN